MDAPQIILLAVIAILTTLLVFLGFQIFLILRDARQSIKKLNNILDETEVILKSIGSPIVNFSQVLTGLRTTSHLLSALFTNRKTKSAVRNLTQKGRQAIEKIEEVADKLPLKEKPNGETKGEESESPSLHLQLKVPRFFKGIPKRR